MAWIRKPQMHWPPELWDRIQDRCLDLGVRPPELIRTVIKRYLDRHDRHAGATRLRQNEDRRRKG